MTENKSRTSRRHVTLWVEPLEDRVVLDATYHNLAGGNFSQNWSNAGLITTNDDWNGVPSIIGYRGDDLTTATGTDPQTILAPGTSTPVDVNANQTDPNTFVTGGVAEFEITNPVVALNGSGTADAPFILLHLDTTNFSAIRITYTLRDIDSSADNSVQQVALQYRVGDSGDFTNVPAGYVADASDGPSLTKETAVDVTLPSAVNNQSRVQVRVITTNAAGNDEWIGIDDILVTGKANLQFSLADFNVSENGGTATVRVERAGDRRGLRRLRRGFGNGLRGGGLHGHFGHAELRGERDVQGVHGRHHRRPVVGAE